MIKWILETLGLLTKDDREKTCGWCGEKGKGKGWTHEVLYEGDHPTDFCPKCSEEE